MDLISIQGEAENNLSNMDFISSPRIAFSSLEVASEVPVVKQPVRAEEAEEPSPNNVAIANRAIIRTIQEAVFAAMEPLRLKIDKLEKIILINNHSKSKLPQQFFPSNDTRQDNRNVPSQSHSPSYSDVVNEWGLAEQGRRAKSFSHSLAPIVPKSSLNLA